jgi:TPR repeat/Tetratricopeptide repeat
MKKKSQFRSGRGATRFGHSQPLQNFSLARLLELASAFRQAQALHQAGRLAEAEKIYGQILKVEPKHADSLHLLGAVYYQRGNHAAAVRQIDLSLKVNSKNAHAFNNRGLALQELKRLDEALASYDKALALKPDYADAFNNRGLALQELRRFDEALLSFERALTVQPDYADVHWNEAILRLVTGDFGRGWAKYEWRWKSESLGVSKRNFSQPLWLGAEAIDGKTILLHSEQGLGDTIQFCRYVPLVAARGARVILEVQRPLHEIMTNLAGATQVISKGDTLPDFDFQCPLPSLPLAFGTRLETIPSATSYLRASDQTLKNWQARLGPKARPRIGLAWSGSPANKNDQNRSISLRSLLPLLDIDATFVSLQKDVRSGDAAVLKERNDVLHFEDAVKDFSNTAALILQLDLVISVDTSIAHLAGALGEPVWILLSYNPDWRWLLDRDDSPWYPSARLFRQQQIGNWAGVIDQVKNELRSVRSFNALSNVPHAPTRSAVRPEILADEIQQPPIFGATWIASR